MATSEPQIIEQLNIFTCIYLMLAMSARYYDSTVIYPDAEHVIL